MIIDCCSNVEAQPAVSTFAPKTRQTVASMNAVERSHDYTTMTALLLVKVETVVETVPEY